jgi:serine/threonine-protein kinase
VQIQDVDSADPQGQVVDQDPDGGVEVEAGSTVTLIVSRGNLLQMPDLRGLTQQQAQRTLSDLGWNGQLTVRRVQVSDGSQIGRVVGQDVPPGSTFTPDQTITIDIGADEDGATTNAGGLPGLPGLPGFP